MPFEITLNLVWAGLGILALTSAFRVCSHSREGARRPQWLLIIGVALIIAALFPYVSASDDMLRMDAFASSHSKTSSSKESGKASDLVRLYEAMDSQLVCRVAAISISFVFLGFVIPLFTSGIERNRPYRAVRSPPAAIVAL